jgi:hypothetical protein
MFTGYLVLGSAPALVPVPLWVLPEEVQLPVIMLAAFVSGLGGPTFLIPMMTFHDDVSANPIAWSQS